MNFRTSFILVLLVLIGLGISLLEILNSDIFPQRKPRLFSQQENNESVSPETPSNLPLVEVKKGNTHYIGLTSLYSYGAFEGKDYYWWGSGGLFSLNKETKKITSFGEVGGVFLSGIGDVVEWDGDVWMTTKEGILRFNPDTKKVRSYRREDEGNVFSEELPYTRKEGLASNANLRFLLFPEANELWVSTFKGPSRYDADRDIWISYGDGVRQLRDINSIQINGRDVLFDNRYLFDQQNERLREISSEEFERRGFSDANNYSVLSERSKVAKELQQILSALPIEPVLLYPFEIGATDRRGVAYLGNFEKSYFFDPFSKSLVRSEVLDKSKEKIIDAAHEKDKYADVNFYPYVCDIQPDWDKDNVAFFREQAEGSSSGGSDMDSEPANYIVWGAPHAFSIKDEEDFRFGDVNKIALGPVATLWDEEREGEIRETLSGSSGKWGNPLLCDNEKILFALDYPRGIITFQFRENHAELTLLFEDNDPQKSFRFVVSPTDVFVSAGFQENAPSVWKVIENKAVPVSFDPIPVNIFPASAYLTLDFTDGNVFVFTDHHGPAVLVYNKKQKTWARGDVGENINIIGVWKGNVLMSEYNSWPRTASLLKSEPAGPNLKKILEFPFSAYLIGDGYELSKVNITSNVLWVGHWAYLGL